MSDSELVDKVKNLTIEDKEEEPVFDPSLKKKKKKKSVAFAGLDDDEEEEADKKEKNDEGEGEDEDEEINEAALFADKKKKKKKKKPVQEDEEDSVIPEKKKGSKKASAEEDEEDNENEQEEDEEEQDADDDEVEGWIGTDRDYTYKELINRFYKICRQSNPELGGEKKRFTIVPPQVSREGSKKTAFSNISDICRRLNRSLDHFTQFLFTELGTTGSVDGSQRLIIKGRFQQKQMETIIRRYIVEYVTCKICKSPDTTLSKENRLTFMQCQSCNSTRSVSAVKTGYQANLIKRTKRKPA